MKGNEMPRSRADAGAVLGRLRRFFARLIARIDLADFPGSCCG